jgi:hypothetical protein
MPYPARTRVAPAQESCWNARTAFSVRSPKLPSAGPGLHIDSLVARLREPRVARILEPMLAGDQTGTNVLDYDFAYVLGLGLIRFHQGRFEIANPIYREVIPRALTFIRQAQIPNEPAWYIRANGSLNIGKLLADFQVFWRKDGHLAAEGFSYREAGPHLMLMAFLQRIVNGGGRIEREYGLGRGALDLMVFWREERHAIELKIRRDTERWISSRATWTTPGSRRGGS